MYYSKSKKKENKTTHFMCLTNYNVLYEAVFHNLMDKETCECV